MIDISKLDKRDVLIALYNNAKPQGLGFLHFKAEPMTREEAETLLKEQEPFGLYFDYVKGRVMKVSLKDDKFDPRLYDRDNGEGAAAGVIAWIETKLTHETPQR